MISGPHVWHESCIPFKGMKQTQNIQKAQSLESLPKNQIAGILLRYKAIKEEAAALTKEANEMKDQILALPAGKYHEVLLGFEERHVKAYEVKARVDTIIKILITE